MDMCIENIVGKRAESPRPDEIIALVEPPEVVKVVKARGTKRCLLTAFGDKTYTRERTPDGGAGSLVLPQLRLDGQDEAMAGEVQGEKGKSAAESGRPSAALRLSVRAKKACMDGGSSMHNSAALERELSQALVGRAGHGDDVFGGRVPPPVRAAHAAAHGVPAGARRGPRPDGPEPDAGPAALRPHRVRQNSGGTSCRRFLGCAAVA